jgi:hypothetical protein
VAVLQIKVPPTALMLIPSDSEAAVFWLTHPNNVVTNNAAVGAIMGFWFAFSTVRCAGLCTASDWLVGVSLANM